MSAPLDLQFVTSAAQISQLPPTSAELAVVGRSNVGKSSLLNALAGKKDLAKVSSKPGRTQLLNLFRLPDGATIVDLPGYGYAATTGAKTRDQWRARMQRYLLDRENLRLTLLLIDGEVGPTRLDEAMLDWLRGYEIQFVVVATKHDKVKSSKRERRKRDLAEACGLGRKDVLWVSAQRNVGLDALRALIRSTLAAAQDGHPA